MNTASWGSSARLDAMPHQDVCWSSIIEDVDLRVVAPSAQAVLNVRGQIHFSSSDVLDSVRLDRGRLWILEVIGEFVQIADLEARAYSLVSQDMFFEAEPTSEPFVNR